MEADYVVVGSGLAALSFSALMARAGRKVVVLEAHDKAGGYGHTFDKGRYRFDAQLHYVWNVGPDRTVGRFLDKVGLTERVPFVQLDPKGYDHMRMPGWALDVPCDYDELARRLEDLFPRDAAALRAFVEEVQRTDEELEALPSSLADAGRLLRSHGYVRLIRHRSATLGDVFARFGLPAEARALLALQWPDFLLPPGQLSFFAFVKLFAGYARGAYYPKHHFHSVIDALVDVIGHGGGDVRFHREVVGFLFEGDRVVGVRVERLDDKGDPTGEMEEIQAREVICNMDPRRAAELIGLERFSSRVCARLAYPYSPSSFVAYLGVSGVDLRAHGFGAWNVFHADDPDLDGIFEANHERGDYGRVSFAMSTPTLVSDAPGIAPPGHHILELLTVASHRRFHELKLRSADAYRAEKERIFDAMMSVIERDYVPGLRDHLTVKVLGSPTTSERFVHAPAGNSYGSVMTPARIWPGRLDHRSSVPGLHFCNASSGFAGFAGTIWTGSRLYQHLSGDRFL
jgi:phytoene dehydrogenase-like protein